MAHKTRSYESPSNGRCVRYGRRCNCTHNPEKSPGMARQYPQRISSVNKSSALRAPDGSERKRSRGSKEEQCGATEEHHDDTALTLPCPGPFELSAFDKATTSPEEILADVRTPVWMITRRAARDTEPSELALGRFTLNVLVESEDMVLQFCRCVQLNGEIAALRESEKTVRPTCLGVVSLLGAPSRKVHDKRSDMYQSKQYASLQAEISEGVTSSEMLSVQITTSVWNTRYIGDRSYLFVTDPAADKCSRRKAAS